MFLVETPASAVFPRHRHLGGEELIILQGGLSDEVGHMGPGDFRSYGPGTVHAPEMDPGETCLALCFVHQGLEFG